MLGSCCSSRKEQHTTFVCERWGSSKRGRMLPPSTPERQKTNDRPGKKRLFVPCQPVRVCVCVCCCFFVLCLAPPPRLSSSFRPMKRRPKMSIHYSGEKRPQSKIFSRVTPCVRLWHGHSFFLFLFTRLGISHFVIRVLFLIFFFIATRICARARRQRQQQQHVLIIHRRHQRSSAICKCCVVRPTGSFVWPINA